MLRYADLEVNFNDKEVWKTDFTEVNQGPRWGSLCLGQEKLSEKKRLLKRDILHKFFPTIDSAKTDEEIGIKLTPLIEQMNKGYFLSDNINEELLLNKANKNTLQKKLQIWCNQLNFNSSIIKSYPGTKIYHNKFKDIPCVVVAAGPSLKNAIDKLRKIKGKALIMSVDTSYRSLIKREIYPDFCNAHDAGERGFKFFKDSDSSKTVALFVNYIHPATIESYKGPICFYYVEDPGVSTYKTMALACDDKNRPDGSFLESCVIGGSSVAHTALYLALNFGCNPITIVGLDLSFPDLNKSHFESDNMKNPQSQQLVDAMDLNGRKVKTNLSFYSYATVFNRMIPFLEITKNVDIFNSSENDDGTPAGIVHYGLKPMKFNDWIDKYATINRPELSNILNEYNKYKK